VIEETNVALAYLPNTTDAELRKGARARAHVRAHAHACRAGPTGSSPRLPVGPPPPWSPPTLRVHLLLPFCHPLFIRSPDTREETWPHASSHEPNNGGYMGPGSLFACSCFDKVGLWPHNTATFFLIVLLLLRLFVLFFTFLSQLAAFSLARYLLPSVSLSQTFDRESLNVPHCLTTQAKSIIRRDCSPDRRRSEHNRAADNAPVPSSSCLLFSDKYTYPWSMKERRSAG